MTTVDSPVFLIGCERSGTTLLRLMLDHHPDISFKFESEFMVSRISSEGEYPEMGAYHDWLADQRAFESSGLQIDHGLDYVALLNSFLEQQRSPARTEIVGTTVHLHFGKLRRIWPRARFIYLYRDGRDVAKSVVQMGWAGNAYVAAEWWLEAEKEWERLRETLQGSEYIEVRYEDFVRDPERHLRRICDFVKVEYSEKMFDYVKNTTYETPDPGLIYQWKSRMQKEELQQVEDKLGDRLLYRGYELSGYPRASVPALMRKFLHLQSKMNTWRHRLRRYGVALALQETLSRRFGLPSVHRDATRQINAIDKTYLK